MHSLKKILFVTALSLSLSSLVARADAAPLPSPAHTGEMRSPVLNVQFQNLQGNGSFKNFTIDLDNGRMVAEDFSFEGLTSRNDLFEADSFTMRNVVVEEEGRTSRIGDLVMENVVFAIPAEEEVDFIGFLKAVADSEADAVIINDVMLQTSDGNVVLSEVRLEDLVDGVAGLASMSGLTFESTDGEAAAVQNLAARDVHAAKLVEILDEAAYGAERIEETAALLGNLTLSAVTFENPGEETSVSIDQVTINEIRGKQFLARPGALVAVLDSLENAEDDMSGESAAQSEWLAVIVGEAIQSDGLEISGVNITGADPENGSFEMAIDTLMIGAGTIVQTPEFSLAGLTFSGESQRSFSGGLASLNGGRGQFLTPEGLEALRADPPLPENYQAFAQEYRRQTLESFTISNLALAADGMELVSMPELSGNGTEDGGVYASNISIPSIQVFMDTVAALGAPQPVIDQLGYEVMDFSIEANGAYDANEQTLGYDQFDITLADGGTLGLSATLGSVPEKVLGTVIPDDQLDIFLNATILEGEISYSDNSLANRLIELAAVMSGTDAAAIRAQATAGASFFALQLGDPMIAQQVSSAVATFIEDPQNLTIAIDPQQPVSVSSVQETAAEGPAAVIRALNLQVSANN